MIQEQGVGRQLLLLLNPENQWTFFPLPFYNIITLKRGGALSLFVDILPFGEEERLSGTWTSRHQQRRSGRRSSYHVIQPIYILHHRERMVSTLGGWKTTVQTSSGSTLPSESLTGRWCCCRPAGRTRFAPVRRARPRGRRQSLLHILPLTHNPWSQCLHFQGRVTPT